MSHIKTENKHAKISPVLQETAQQEQDAKNNIFLLLLWLLFKILKPQEMIEYEQIHFVIFSLCVLGTTLQLCSSYRYRDQ